MTQGLHIRRLAHDEPAAGLVARWRHDAYFADHPDATTLIESNDVVPSYLFLLARRPSVEDKGKRAALEDFVGRLARASEWIKDHEDEWIDTYYVGVQKQTPEAGRAAYDAQGNNASSANSIYQSIGALMAPEDPPPTPNG